MLLLQLLHATAACNCCMQLLHATAACNCCNCCMHTGPRRPINLAPLRAYNPARKDQDDKDQEQRLMLGFHVPRNKAEEAESVMTFVALVGFFLTGMFFIVPEMHIFAPALYRALTGQ
jgi:hypothetical protein